MAEISQGDVTYLNVNFTGEYSDTVARTTKAEKTVSKSGTIIDAADGYVAVMRLTFTANNPIIIAPCTSAQFTADGTTTDWSMTVKYTDAAGTEFLGRAFIQLPVTTPIIGQTQQPTDLYAAFWSPESWVAALTNCVRDAYGTCDAAATAGGSPIGITEFPFFSLIPDGGGRIRLTVQSFALWDQRGHAVGVPKLELFINWAMQPAVGGWSFIANTLDNRPLNANGEDYLWDIRSDGNNYTPVTAPPAFNPANPATAALLIDQTFITQKLPGITKVAVVSSLPTMQEFIPSEDGKGSRAVLTDFAPDPAQMMQGQGQTTLIYNASVGDARWIKLKGGAPISTFHVRAITEDWLGQVRTIELQGNFETFDLKLCFAPKRVVEGFTSRGS